MKKSLLAVAAMTAFAGAAQAQSSVTVYGILDVGYQGSNNSVKATGTGGSYTIPTASSGGGNSKSTYSGLGQGAESTNRIGFKGTEDLGGGTSAFFTIEYTLYPQEQDVSGSAQGGLRNRQTFVGLSKKGIGQGAIGTQYTPLHIAVGKTDAAGQNNMTGDLMYTGQGDAFGVQGASAGNSGAYQTRYSNSITFDTEVIGGFQGHLMGVATSTNSTVAAVNTNGTTTVGGKNNTTGVAVGADYTWKKLFVTANYSQMKQITDTTNCAPNSVNGATAPAAGTCGFAQFGQSSATGLTITGYDSKGNPSNVVDTTQYYAGTYDFGILKAYAQYINRKAVSATNSSDYISRTASQIGVRGYITPTIESWAQGGVGKFTPYGSTQPSANMTAWQLGSNYWMSKRTNLYAIYGQYSQSQANYATTLGGAQTQSYSQNSNSYGVGVRHTF